MTRIQNERFMRLAIEKAKEGVRRGQTPFGACIVKNGTILSCAHNAVWSTTDMTAHAEIQAIRAACRKIKSIDLSGCVIYSTCEPCPMCFSACHWGRIEKIFYGVSIQDAKRIGFNELTVSNQELKKLGQSPVDIVGGFLRKENQELFDFWVTQKKKRVY